MSDGKERIEITDEHFRIFKSECERWIEIFGLKGWNIKIVHTDETDERAAAWMQAQYNQRQCGIYLPKFWNADPEINQPDEATLRRHAFHEVCELLLERMSTVAECRWVQEDELIEAKHEVIRILENVVWEPSILSTKAGIEDTAKVLFQMSSDEVKRQLEVIHGQADIKATEQSAKE